MAKKLDLSKHFLSFKHEKLTKKEVDQLLKRYNASLWDLPKISINDPGLKNLDVKPGDVVRIHRYNPYRGKFIYYRVVVRE